MNWLLKGTPYDVQSLALKEAEGRRRFGYFLEMGLWKSAVCINEYSNLLLKGRVDLMVVICPNSLKGVWKDQIKEWAGLKNTVLWEGQFDKSASNGVFVINYEAVYQRGGDYLGLLLRQNRCYVVLDESIAIKNPRAQRTRALLRMLKTVEYVRLCSGAPMVNNTLDLWPQLKMLDARVNSNPFAFRGRYCVMGGWKGKQIIGARNQDQLQEVMKEVSIVAKKKDWTDLPDKLYNVRNYEMKGELKKHYDSMEKDFFVAVEENEAVFAEMVITQLTKLQQISSGFVYNEKRKAVWLVDNKNNPKLKVLKEIINETPGKIIIFCYFKPTVAMLMENLDNPAKITGGMKTEEIEEEKKKFNEGDAKILVAQLTAAKYGHTLLGTEQNPCHTSVYYENFYSLDARLQSEDRNHRHGQKYPVTYIDLVGSGIEKKVISALQKKQNLVDAVVNHIKSSNT